MDRRSFLGISLTPLFPSSGVFAIIQGSSEIAPDYIFYDERFYKAVNMAGQVVGADKIIGVRGDVTSLWNNKFKTVAMGSALAMAGITTESFYFCLHRMLQTRHQVDAVITRIDQDLYAWSIYTVDQNNRSAA